MRSTSKFLVFFYFLLFSQINIPQTWELIGGPTGTTPNNEIILNDGRVLCSTYKGVFISDDFGDTWKISKSSQNFNGVYALTERLNGEVLAIARSGIIKSEDKGENWSIISYISSLSDYGSVIYESPVDSALYFAKSPSIYKSTDGGFNWSVIWQGNIIDGFTINESGWIYLSDRYNNILISRDNGNSFSILPVGINFTYGLAYSMYSDKHEGLYFMISNGPYSIVHFGNNQLTYIEDGWTDIPLGVTSVGDLVYKSGNCINLFEYSTKQSRQLSCPSFVKDQFAKNVVTKDNVWIANFTYLGIHRSNDAGKTWKSINSGLGFTESTAMHITRNGKFIVSAFSGAFWGNLYSSTDDGVTWVQRNPPLDPVFYDIDTLVNGNIVATGSYGIYTANNEASNWIQRLDTEIASYVFVSKSGVAYAGTRPNGMMISRNNGVSWSHPNGLSSAYFSSFGESSEGRIFAGASAYLEGIYYSDDEGNNWTQINPFPFSGVYDFITKGDSIYAGTQGGVYKSYDNGMNWKRLNYENIRKFEMAPNGDLIGINTYNGIVSSKDNGKTWENLGDGLKDRAIRDLCFDSDNRLYALTDSGIFRNNEYIYPSIINPVYGADKLLTTVQFEWSEVPSANNYELELYNDSLLTSLIQSVLVSENSASINSLLTDKTYYWRVKASSNKFNNLYTNIGKFKTAPPFSMQQNYPNPFNAGTTIEFYVPYISNVKLKVFNILGEVIETLVDAEYPEGTHQINWNASGLSSGIYFIQIDGNEFRQIKKAVLIK